MMHHRHDVEGIITSWTGAERIFGFTSEEAVGKPKAMLFPPTGCTGDRNPGEARRASVSIIRDYSGTQGWQANRCVADHIADQGRRGVHRRASTIARDITD